MRHIMTMGAALGAVLGVVCGLGEGLAGAQERGRDYLSETLPAPQHALELKVGTAYTQGFGMLAPGRRLPDVAGPGLGVSAEADYRLSPRWSLGAEVQYQEFKSEENSSSRGLAANLGATYHLSPAVRGDPWLRLAGGYRLLWENDPSGASGSTVLRHGFELASLKVGYDVRVSEEVAIAPVVGADVNLFLWEAPSAGSGHALASAQGATFVYAGLQGRFDLGGSRREETSEGSKQPVAVTAPQPQSPIATVPPAEEVQPVSPTIALSEDVLRDCRLNLDAVEKAPKFAFDQSELLPADMAVLDAIAECFASGPLKDRGMVLVGRADPRGSVPYNDALGARRAQRVAEYLERRGIDASRIDQSSRGKRDARGTDEASWAVDRRVDVLEGR